MDDSGLIILSPRFGASLHDNLLGKIAASLLVPVLQVSSSFRHPSHLLSQFPCFLPLFELCLKTSSHFKKVGLLELQTSAWPKH